MGARTTVLCRGKGWEPLSDAQRNGPQDSIWGEMLVIFPAIFAKISDSFPARYCQREGAGLAGPHRRSRLCS